MFRMKFQNLLPSFSRRTFLKETANHDVEAVAAQVVRAKPERLDVLCRNTKFTRKELQIMYRGFKQECPSGIVDEVTFIGIYSQFFPQGDPSDYARYVFNAFDPDHKGAISFEDFVSGLSVLARGTVQAKLEWIFRLYDINGDGMVTRDEMYGVISSIYDIMGRFAQPCVDETTVHDHVQRVFSKMDLNSDGIITEEEFMKTCQQDDSIFQSIAMFDTVL